MKKIYNIGIWILKKGKPYGVKLIVIYLLNMILSLCGVGLVVFVKEMIDNAIDLNIKRAVYAGINLLVVIIIQMFLRVIVSIWMVRTKETMINHIRGNLFKGLSYTKWAPLSKYHSGDLLTRMTKDTTSLVEGMVGSLSEVLSLITALIGSFITLFIFDPFLAVFSLILVPFGLGVSYLMGKAFMNVHMKAKQAESSLRSYLQEALEHLLIIKTFCQEKKNQEKIHLLQGERTKYAIKSNRMNVTASSFMIGGYWLSYFIVFAWGAMRLSLGTTTFGTFTAFIQLVGQVQQPFMGLGQSVPELIGMAASAKRLMEIERLEMEEEEEISIGSRFEGITFDDVSFAYQEDQYILKHIDVDINPGENIGLVGESGCGKTTLLHLLLSLYQPTEGIIYIRNDQERRKVKNIRNIISYVPQGNTLLSGTIADNLRMGKSDATEEEMVAALKEADAWDFVCELADGMETVIGERGLGLSEGQAQRIAIGRAVIRNSPILLLDEATSALDIESEQKILQSIIGAKKDRTCIIVTHRIAVLDYCQRIWKIIDGGIYEDEMGELDMVSTDKMVVA